ncbi:LysR family transcriptional regulator [Paenibacillus sp. 1011MAR3C5]|uniref:LysR family transcriptional regulator n=1 Tax=Paenibacillus sp. 1011MAR3C5 TaxID=1675787 RepID=UPI000E6CB661|nr:LysR family transcriptional regulator [Paenibacillus sp. 1011MAR3C5]RJE88362.1 LysR family transcriptional regulator [Paenibacillus sp. 1011MAR3C5]
MSLIKYQIFSEVVEQRSLTRAGEKLNLTQSAISHAVSSLEAEFGLILLKRSKSGVLLTADGERLIPHIRQVLQLNEKLKQEVAALKGGEIGKVKIGTFSSVTIHWLPRILRDFCIQCPGIEIKLQDGNHTEMENMLMDGSVDLGFITLPTCGVFHMVPLKKDRMMCMMPVNHPLERQAVIKVEQLADEPFIMPVTGCSSDVQRILSQHHIQPNIKYELEGDHAIIAMVQNGLGISILPEMAVSQIPANISCRPLEGEYDRTIGLAIPSYDTASPAAKKLYSFITNWIEQDAAQNG